MIKLTKKRKPGKGIIDNSKNVLIETIPFYENGTIETMQVSIDLEHPSIGDLVIKMRNPAGLEVLLHNREAMETTTLNKVYDQEIMAPFADSNLRGNWTLIIEDQVANEEGILYSWSIGLDYFDGEEKEALAIAAIPEAAPEVEAEAAPEVEAEAAPEVEAEAAPEVEAEAAPEVEAEAAPEAEAEAAVEVAIEAAAEATAFAEIEVEAEAAPEEEVAPEEVSEAEVTLEEVVEEVQEASADEKVENATLEQIQEELEAGNGDIIALENHQLLAMLGGKKVNLGKIAGKIEGNGNVYLELIKE